MDNLTVELVKTAQNREYTKFEEVAKELLKSKLQETESYVQTMKKLQEACGKKISEDDEDNDPDSKDAKQNSDDEDNDGKKDSDEKHGDLKKDFTGKHKDADKED